MTNTVEDKTPNYIQLQIKESEGLRKIQYMIIIITKKVITGH